MASAHIVSVGEGGGHRERLARLVDALDRSSLFLGEPSRQLLLRRTERHLARGRRLYLSHQDVRRLWFVALVDALDEEPVGLAALSGAVTDLAPGSKLAEVVAEVAVEAAVDWRRDASPHGADQGSTDGDAPHGVAPATVGALATGGNGQLRHDGLTADQEAELARVFSRPTEVADLLDRAGVPRERFPDWDGLDSAAYWRAVSRLLRHGIVIGGSRAVLAAAASRYPANPVFVSRGPG